MTQQNTKHKRKTLGKELEKRTASSKWIEKFLEHKTPSCTQLCHFQLHQKFGYMCVILQTFSSAMTYVSPSLWLYFIHLCEIMINFKKNCQGKGQVLVVEGKMYSCLGNQTATFPNSMVREAHLEGHLNAHHIKSYESVSGFALQWKWHWSAQHFLNTMFIWIRCIFACGKWNQQHTAVQKVTECHSVAWVRTCR